MSDPGRYTVGWIYAIATEFVTAQAIFDEAHNRAEQVATKDNNSYALGRIGEHNIAIAVLPDSEYSTNSAATVTRDMLHSFFSIRIRLKVEIRGRTPNDQHDIRLRDDVVIPPQSDKKGVFQYRFNKSLKEALSDDRLPRSAANETSHNSQQTQSYT